ncbi:glycosyltransferase family 39 protein [Candidatus Saccharibacteria bacterium]|nr:glycosyltransferase family 39 protein [Candidatus Saccharibacteria bacterium]
MPSRYHRITTTLAILAREYDWFIVSALAILMFGLGITSMVGESAIVDEVAHIPAAYSYDHFGDYRLNPEHPPLIKNLAGLPLQFLGLQFPNDRSEWTTAANGQWETGWDFIYNMGNNASEILFWARLPILLLAVGFTFFLYRYVRHHWGIGAGLLATLFYTLSPNIIAHARYVTTDVGATIFIFVALATFLRFIRVPSGRNVLWLSLALAVANLVKFNGVLLYPFLLVMAIVAGFVMLGHDRATRLKLYIGGLFGASALSLVWIYIYYIPNIINMPAAVQSRLVAGSLTYGPGLQVASLMESLTQHAVARPLVQYFLGVAMVFGRVQGGNVTYFNGMVKNGSYHLYFPELFAVKTQVALLILMVILTAVGLVAAFRGHRSLRQLWIRFTTSLRHNFIEWTLGLFVVFYFVVSVMGNLNLGIRHILPIYLPIFVLVAVGTMRLMRRLSRTKWATWSGVSLAVLALWYALSTILAYPAYTAYFNELIGGGGNADKYFSDSGVDWGQDLVQLKNYTTAHHITSFALDYFGGGSPDYYFCDRKYDISGHLIATGDGYNCSQSGMVPWHSQNGPYTGQYIAVSETFLENDRYYSALDNTAGYAYLRAHTPVAKIGNSIYLYKLR